MSSKYDSLLEAVKKPKSLDPKWDGTTDTIKAFAELLVELAKDATEQTERNIRVQKWLLGFSIALLVLTFALLVFTYLLWYRP